MSRRDPLADIRVLDLSRLIPGALASRKLADLGADVVKVEQPGRGDYLRQVRPIIGGASVWHHLLNRGKRSIALDLLSASGLEQFNRLVAKADVLIESARPGRWKQLGLDLDAVRRRHPALVVCSISGFGQTGPWRDLPSHGKNMDALAGVMPIVDDGQSAPRMSLGLYASLGSEAAGLNAAFAILAAVHGARSSGTGAWLDISCWDSAVEMNRAAMAIQAATGASFEQQRGEAPLYALYRTSDDGLVLFAAIEFKFFERFCVGIGRPDLLTEWRSDGELDFGDDGLRNTLEPIFAERTASQWQQHFLDWDVTGCQVMDPRRLLGEPHLAERGLLIDGEPGLPPTVLDPVRFADSGERVGTGRRPAPELGADEAVVLHEWLETT
ncbi:CaiB/BaiF CoA transferase family protein [[Mycobacterium] vasticus]|uniref:CaiB/BaiF CoA-transferase family protein n=1 Tax=[Mycobacterium] vasticus TaxID=2875777 RepID=A0ABU5YYT1_9MYCO|nr:CaiB/BaiF CoA-transferase family protein [Mycolicibacter sp. MYC017]MEB3070287.1 CaiB/BaiF CoA-transferase family protein [Mycolicibacter sp. MYC017]